MSGRHAKGSKLCAKIPTLEMSAARHRSSSTPGWSFRIFPAADEPVRITHAAGPLYRPSVEGDADPFLLAPDDMARPLQLL
jgi:hypothetical protein